MTALYLERYLNYGLTREELQGGSARSSASRKPAATSSPATAIILSLRAACATAFATRAAFRSNFRCIRCRKRASGPPRRWSATWPILGLVEILFGYPLDGVVLTDGLRQDHARRPHGRRDRRSARHRALRRPDARTAISRASLRAPARQFGRRAAAMPRARSITTASWTSSWPPRRAPGIATPWARQAR